MVPPSRSAPPVEVEELLAVWEMLDRAVRADLLAVARGLAAAKLKTGEARNR